jgi:DAK2 domain fusion protein YloV
MKSLNYKKLIEMYNNGANQLFNKYRKIDALNVFPVPDGDTGTNMNFTINSGIKAISSGNFNGVGEVAKAFSKGCLMGARGNSGVITSQIMKGFANGLDGVVEATAADFVKAFKEAKIAAYAAVGQPVEGTMLTTVREIAEDLEVNGDKYDDIQNLLLHIVEAGNKSVENTPNLLPVLKEAGVVDSGAYGVMEFVYGMFAFTAGRIVARDEKAGEVDFEAFMEHDDHEGAYGYCTEFVVVMHEEGQQEVAQLNMFTELEKFGDSVAVVADEEILKMHVHTLKPEEAMAFAHKFGEFHTIKIENMQEQVESKISESKEVREVAVVCVANGEGVKDYFNQNGIQDIVYGGQTMNPSTETIIEAIKSANANNVIVLPNNKNIVMAANQAKEILTEIKVEVIETRSIVEGIAACANFNIEVDLATNVEEMKEAVKEVTTAQVTTAIKDTTIGGVEVKDGENLLLVNGKIVASVPNKIVEYLEDKGFEVELIEGKQAVYPYIFGGE